LFDQLPVDARWCLVHATHLDDEELAQLAKSGAVAGICTTTEANLGDGFFRMHEYLQQGGVFGVGSDSHISVSAVEELRWLEYGQRLQKRERAVLGSRERSVGRQLYEGALFGGARAAGRHTGAIAAGNAADLIVLQADVRDERVFGSDGDAILDSWLFAGNGNRVSDVMVQGAWCIRDGYHEAEESITANYGEVMRQLLA
jgi:formimidoylglutamate deiminase